VPVFGLLGGTALSDPEDLPSTWTATAIGTIWLLVLDGALIWETAQQRHWLAANAVVQMTAAELRRSRFMRRPARCRLAVLSFDGELAELYGRFLKRRFGRIHLVEPGAAIFRHAREILIQTTAGTLQPGSSHSERLAATWIYAWHSYLLEHRPSLMELCARGPAHNHFDAFAPRTVKHLAAQMGYSRAHLTRLLRQHWGETPAKLLRGLRLERAANLLKSTTLPAHAIATQAGYDSVSGFFAAFRQHHAATPAATRRRRRVGSVRSTESSHVPGPLRSSARTAPVVPTLGHSTPLHDEVRTSDWDGPYLRLLTCGEIDRPNRRPFEMSLNAMISRRSIVITVAGEAAFETPDGSQLVGPGIAVAYRTPIDARWRNAPGSQRWQRVWLQFTGELAERVFDDTVARFGHVQSIPIDSPLIKQARAMMSWIRGRWRSPAFWSHQTYLWLLAWREHLERTAPLANQLRLAQRETRLFDHRRRTLRAYAQHLGYSLSYLSVKLKSQWNVSPGVVLRTARLDHGATLLRATAKPIAAIARECGYATPSAFIVAFKKRTGLTPLHYRRRHRA
jgi:AraC-like DNA-binding protein